MQKSPLSNKRSKKSTVLFKKFTILSAIFVEKVDNFVVKLCYDFVRKVHITKVSRYVAP